MPSLTCLLCPHQLQDPAHRHPAIPCQIRKGASVLFGRGLWFGNIGSGFRPRLGRRQRDTQARDRLAIAHPRRHRRGKINEITFKVPIKIGARIQGDINESVTAYDDGHPAVLVDMNLTAGVRHALNSERLITPITINVA